jgi:hypothetical protein
MLKPFAEEFRQPRATVNRSEAEFASERGVSMLLIQWLEQGKGTVPANGCEGRNCIGRDVMQA